MTVDPQWLIALAVGFLTGAVMGSLVMALIAGRRVAGLEAESSALRISVKTQEALDAERTAALAAASQRVHLAFEEMAGRSLRDNSETFLRLARENLGQYQTQATADLTARKQAVDDLIGPIAETLAKTREELARIERDRRQAFGAIDQQLQTVGAGQESLQAETRKLVNVLQRPDVGGQWGEITLRRLIEIAGMVEHCDFVEQQQRAGEKGVIRPDLVVRLPERGEVIVDAKTPLEAYLAAANAGDDQTRNDALKRHARNLRNRVRELAGKSYWSQFPHSPEFVILFLPGDQYLSAALSKDPALLEDALTQRILLVTPTSLIAVLKAVAYGWRQSALAENAERVREVAEELYRRLATFSEHLAGIGTALTRSVEVYNKAVGSLERQVLPSARRFTEMGVSERKTVVNPAPVTTQAREPRAGTTADLLADADPDGDDEQ